MRVMDKRIILSLPGVLYQDIKKAAARHYQTVSAYVRESVLEKISEEPNHSKQYDKLIRKSLMRSAGDKAFESAGDAIDYLKKRSKNKR